MTEPTALFRMFAGRRRKLVLRLGEVEELERLTGGGIGEVFVRLATSRHKLADVRETIRLALQGGGAPPAEADALIASYVDSQPLLTDDGGGNLQLAADIVGAFHRGAASVKNDGDKPEEEATAPGDLTSFYRALGTAGFSPEQTRAMTIEEAFAVMDGFAKFNGGGEKDDGASVTTDDIAYQQQALLEEEAAGRA